MLCLTANRPKLEIPAEVWNRLEYNDFINFSVPLLNPPVEFEGRVYWGGRELMMLSPTLAAFARFEESEALMPYDEMFRIVANDDETMFAQVYAVFFEKEGDEWFMMYRLMNADRLVREAASEARMASDDGIPASNWMLTSSEQDEWMTVDAFTRFFCEMAGYDSASALETLEKQLEYMEGSNYNIRDARVKPLTGGMVILVPKLTKCCALMIDVTKNTRIARFVMDDPPHLIRRFWNLNSKMFLSGADRAELRAVASDAWHYSHAMRSAREQLKVEEEITASAFYC